MQRMIRHVRTKVTVVLLASMLIVGLSPSPAHAAGACEGSICVGTAQGQNPVYLAAYSVYGPPGWYHVHFWGRNNDFNTEVNWLDPGFESLVALESPLYRGQDLCAELWMHRSDGSLLSFGSPCLTHDG